ACDNAKRLSKLAPDNMAVLLTVWTFLFSSDSLGKNSTNMVSWTSGRRFQYDSHSSILLHAREPVLLSAHVMVNSEHILFDYTVEDRRHGRQNDDAVVDVR